MICETQSPTWRHLKQRSDEQDGSPQDTTRTPLSEDSHQHGLMLAAYREVGNDYAVTMANKQKGWKPCSVPRRWPVPLLKCVEYLDRVLCP